MKKFFKKEDKEYKAKYEKWLEESNQVFDYDSDLEEEILEEKGAEYSKMTTLVDGFGLDVENHGVVEDVKANDAAPVDPISIQPEQEITNAKEPSDGDTSF